MPLQANAVDVLVEKADFGSDVALAIAEAMDLTIQAHHEFVVIPVLDARFAAMDVRFAAVDVRFAAVDVRFTSLEKLIESSIASLKVWVMTVHMGLAVTFFGALAVDTHWLVSREDQLIAQVQARSDQRFQQIDTHLQQVDAHFQRYDEHFQQVDEHFRQIDARFQQMDARFQQVDDHFQRIDAQLREIRALLVKRYRREPK